MKVVDGEPKTVEDYLKFEETSEVKHEFYYGKLFKMPEAPVLHNNICLRLFFVLFNTVKQYGFQVNVENVKVKIDNEEIYLYPDILVTAEHFSTMKDYLVYHPTLIAEVLSDSTRKYDSTDKFIQYQKLSALRYYLLVEPEKHVVIFYEKDDAGDWSAKTYTELSQVINLPVLQTQITLRDNYA